MARACDRCSRLKTQCNGDLPCNRCQRLALECSQTRPILAKGRPKRDTSSTRPRRQNTSQRAESESASPQATIYNTWHSLAPSEYSLELVRRLPELPVAEPVAAHLLDLVLSSISTVGIFEVFTGIYDSSPRLGFQPTHSKRINPSLHPLFHSKALLYTLIALGAAICCPPDPAVNITSLQQYALNSVPALYGNSRDLKIDDALSLCFLSYMGCLNASSLKVAERWAVLAVVISRQANDTEGEHSPDWEAFRQRASSLIRINDRIFSLLHHRQPFDTTTRKTGMFEAHKAVPKSPPSIADKMSIGGVLSQPPEAPKVYMKTDYFALFTPLLKPLDIVLNEPQPNSPESQQALEDLERYYLEFPLILISYNEIRLLHQVEAMIWFHGIFLLLDGKRDLFGCFEDKLWVSSPAFIRTTEHALLLGEAIPALARLTTIASQLSPATVYFILLSSVIHAVVLRQCLGNSTTMPSFVPQVDPDQASWTTLLESSRLHLFILGKIREESSICNIDLVPAVEAVLQTFYAAATTGRTEWDIDFQVLKLYRWTERGRGIVKVSPKAADELSRLSVSGAHGNSGSNSLDSVTAKQKIMALCDPRTRRCRPGYFASSIRGGGK